MDYPEAQRLLERPAFQLLRLPSAAFVLAFLHTAFRQNPVTLIAEDSLLLRLERWIEERRREHVFQWERAAYEYLVEWSSEHCGWLRKLIADPAQGAHYELSAATEKALLWMEELRDAGRFVGTESRMENIFRELEELLRHASGDVPARLDALRAERDRLDEEILRIASTGRLAVFEPWQVNERYSRIVDSARVLISDFRQVEENFRQLAQDLVESQSMEEGEKGALLGRVLDSHDTLRESSQGRSFYGFVRLLLDPDRRERFEQQVAAANRLPSLAPELKAEPTLPRLMPRLRSEQEKVSASTQRLTGNLRRALESGHLNERRRVRDLISEIQRLALLHQDAPPASADFFEVEELPPVYSGMSRPLWEENGVLAWEEALTLEGGLLDFEKLRQLQDLPHLSLEVLAANVAACLEEAAFISLSAVLERFPPAKGMLEVLGYLILAARAPGRHEFAPQLWDAVALPGGRAWRLPRVKFRRTAPNEPAPPLPPSLETAAL